MTTLTIVIIIFVIACVVLIPTVGMRIMKRNALVADSTKPSPRVGKFITVLPYIVLVTGGIYLFITRIMPLMV